ncbi:hypothetical protein BpJC7_23380 [Weizmannia acidilactici]|uniref:Uncharacterized protein n=1 Tax=Weizmannia acidilactici TaxID=2607726 RepID=A0A5J4JK15_9BACI|nr:hypothetical protein BpJC4_26590 [Weizmannia acidilactici]GER71035.1 hypothetical protein BpJC7_23380 [Weizmannia acidilactici]GER74476.1 hypothetical protein BpPP18_25430 [Weizmannia acidilactici]
MKTFTLKRNGHMLEDRKVTQNELWNIKRVPSYEMPKMFSCGVTEIGNEKIASFRRKI